MLRTRKGTIILTTTHVQAHICVLWCHLACQVCGLILATPGAESMQLLDTRYKAQVSVEAARAADDYKFRAQMGGCCWMLAFTCGNCLGSPPNHRAY